MKLISSAVFLVLFVYSGLCFESQDILNAPAIPGSPHSDCPLFFPVSSKVIGTSNRSGLPIIFTEYTCNTTTSSLETPKLEPPREHSPILCQGDASCEYDTLCGIKFSCDSEPAPDMDLCWELVEQNKDKDWDWAQTVGTGSAVSLHDCSIVFFNKAQFPLRMSQNRWMARAAALMKSCQSLQHAGHGYCVADNSNWTVQIFHVSSNATERASS
ncbi:hypothetical protein BXZ70DRAFT_654111 [Cristinia sonorae]|uniref:MAM domain-containing protein n=1 Tax=Cristinia sonorae TaxID=1940300 RepID=A0A8K0UF38_9AGAR|nr:hypothetical protein BXZ70DRAFT_654111 [Cristinia sonorae]